MRTRILALLLALSASLSAATDPNLILPGKGIGPVRSTMTASELEKLCKPGEYMEGEAGGQTASTLWELDAKRRVTVLWGDKHKLQAMVLYGEASVWHTREGITLGTPLSKLAGLNGKPFTLHAFEGDRYGEVTDWGGGKLAALLPRVTLALTMRVDGYNGLSGSQKEELDKNRSFRSDDPVIVKLDPRVERIQLEF